MKLTQRIKRENVSYDSLVVSCRSSYEPELMYDDMMFEGDKKRTETIPESNESNSM